MSLSIGTAGAAMMLAGGAIAPLPESIFGRPIIWTEHCSNLGDVGDIILVHPRSILLGLRKDLTVEGSIHKYFDTNETLFRIEARLDAQPIVNEKLTLRSGGGFQVSPFVTLAERA
jgi:HK97 family phage major capsid protein